MSAGTTPDARELLEQALRLSAAEREQLALDLLDSVEPEPGQKDWEAEIARRSEEVASGAVTSLTREQAEAEVREAIRKLGVEL